VFTFRAFSARAPFRTRFRPDRVDRFARARRTIIRIPRAWRSVFRALFASFWALGWFPLDTARETT